ncbi:phosphomannomutase/phosphoglucomutase [Agrococcus sp. Marseille-Q4369]|uniref:phosphomannomutase/phosphoglucomutase n=1 Tax=Agrococcus sp. Marseille-Q4369 TaxID=2810513 RepID=UPI001B8ACC18|nr:phosphomannomutase/phosphoglucomutase [Agrococcus sp. Marseille-Q4369]QUW18580.1 phosphomannomutase/phosphoglucomutase [Agrococcus sp. Marseille-Q4369]
MTLSEIVKAYDVRGLVDGQLTEEVVRALGAAFADEVGTDAPIAIGHDMRPSSPALAAAAAEGAMARGADVVSLGLCSTDGSYFASGSLDAPAMMFTASHNPAAYNGIKFSRAGARGVSLETGLAAIRDGAQRYLEHGIPAADRRGSRSERDILADYAAHLRSLVDLSRIRPLKVVVDAANGMGGLTVPAVLGEAAGLGALPIEVVPMYFELDGTFPNHEANPLDPKNLVDLQAAVVEHGADLGLAFDGDADRCFVIDERGGAVSPSAVAAIVAEREIARVRAEGEEDVVVIHNLITSRVVPEVIAAAGATPVRTRVGHSLIKDRMAETGAVFGGEHSAHYYFRDFWGADNGMLAAMHVLATLGAHDEPMSELAARYSPYAASGEINSTVDDMPAAYTRIVEAFAGRGDLDELDGLTITAPDGAWWFSVRPSNTEPLLRLNAEAETEAEMVAIRDEVLALIRA